MAVSDRLHGSRRRIDWPSPELLLRAPRAVVSRYSNAQHRHWRIVATVEVLYALLFSGWLIYSHTYPAPDLVAIFLLLFAFLAARGFSFLRDWSPFILLLLAYVGLTGLQTGLAQHAHLQFPINADRAIFRGVLPTTWLQSHLWRPPRARWYDYLAVVLYPLHFVVPLVVAFVLWMWRKRFYWRFVASYLLLSYAGFVTYVLYPMAPPWWAANAGRIPPVASIIDQVQFGVVVNPVVLATQFFKPNPVAAMPSIHAAFPVLVWLVTWRVWPRFGWALVLYPLGVAFAVVYLGEHYVIDVLAGWLYAAIAFALVWVMGSRSWVGENGRQPSAVSYELPPMSDYRRRAAVPVRLVVRRR